MKSLCYTGNLFSYFYLLRTKVYSLAVYFCLLPVICCKNFSNIIKHKLFNTLHPVGRRKLPNWQHTCILPQRKRQILPSISFPVKEKEKTITPLWQKEIHSVALKIRGKFPNSFVIPKSSLQNLSQWGPYFWKPATDTYIGRGRF